MTRKALIVYCDNTESGKLPGPSADNQNLRTHLTSPLGGDWYDSEIISLNNPTKLQVLQSIRTIGVADYSFVVFSGHGYINTADNHKQYVELSDGDLSISNLVSNSKRQTIIIDACRGYYSPTTQMFSKGLSGTFENFSGRQSTRKLFDHHLNNCEEGLSVMYAASKNQSASDSDKGGAYLFSILKVCEIWAQNDSKKQKFSIRDAHNSGIIYMNKNFETKQKPTMHAEKRMRYFPLAVKWTQING